MKLKLKANKYNIIFVSECLLLFVLSLFFVPQCDDLIFLYVFEYSNLKEFMHHVLYYGNGRLLGNICALFFSRHMELFHIFEIILMAAFSILVEKLTELRNSKIFVLAAITAVPLWQFKELIVWMSAFVNYFIPIVLFLLTLLIIKKNLCIKSKFFFAVLFLVGICEQLFVESNTIINIFFVLILLLYFIKSKAAHIKEALVLLVSNILGAAVMFGYKYYIDYSQTHVFKTMPNYRTDLLSALQSEGITGAVVFMARNIKYFMLTLSSCTLLVCALFAIMICIEMHADKKAIKHKSVFAIALIAYVALFGVTTCYFVVYNNDVPDGSILFALFLLLAVITFVLISLLFIKIVLKRMEKAQRIRIYFLLFFALLSFAPFLLVSPYSYRCAFLSVFFVLLTVLEAMKFANEQYGFTAEKVYDAAFIAFIVAVIIYAGPYAKEKKVFDYKAKYCTSSYYLPQSNQSFLVMTPDSSWIRYSGLEHEFIPLEEFEDYISENNNQ